jgi:hypothetical protein
MDIDKNVNKRCRNILPAYTGCVGGEERNNSDVNRNIESIKTETFSFINLESL